MKVKVWCSQCSYVVEKDVAMTNPRVAQEEVRRAFAEEADNHEHGCWYLRASWSTSDSFYETRLCGDDPP